MAQHGPRTLITSIVWSHFEGLLVPTNLWPKMAPRDPNMASHARKVTNMLILRGCGGHFWATHGPTCAAHPHIMNCLFILRGRWGHGRFGPTRAILGQIGPIFGDVGAEHWRVARQMASFGSCLENWPCGLSPKAPRISKPGVRHFCLGEVE